MLSRQHPEMKNNNVYAKRKSGLTISIHDSNAEQGTNPPENIITIYRLSPESTVIEFWVPSLGEVIQGSAQ